ncbi:S-layer homology domain-containing protein [Paenibacillus polymyxa]
MQELAGLYMITGYEDGSFRPMQHLSRSEAAALIFRLNKLIQVMDENRTDQVKKASAFDRHI